MKARDLNASDTFFLLSLVLLVVLSLTGCTEQEPGPPIPRATQETELDLGNTWMGNVVVLPTGERVLLTYRYHVTSTGGQISTAAVLLPARPVEGVRR